MIFHGGGEQGPTNRPVISKHTHTCILGGLCGNFKRDGPAN